MYGEDPARWVLVFDTWRLTEYASTLLLRSSDPQRKPTEASGSQRKPFRRTPSPPEHEQLGPSRPDFVSTREALNSALRGYVRAPRNAASSRFTSSGFS